MLYINMQLDENFAMRQQEATTEGGGTVSMRDLQLTRSDQEGEASNSSPTRRRTS